MVWIVGIGIGLLLIFSFPRQMGLLFLVLAAAAVALFAFVNQSNQRAAASRVKELALVEVTARGDISYAPT